MAEAQTTATSFQYEDSPKVEALPKNVRPKAPNPLQGRVEQALKDKRKDPDRDGYFLGNGIRVASDKIGRDGAKLIHDAAQRIDASAKVSVTAAKDAPGKWDVNFSVNPIRRTRG